MKKIISFSLVLTLIAISILSAFSVSAEKSEIGTSYRKDFVYTDGTHFMLNGKPFYYAGTNNYYINFKHKADVDNLMQDAKDMGLKVIRTWGFLDVGTWTGETNQMNGYPIFTDNMEGSGEKEGVYYQYFDASLNKPVVNEGANGLAYLDYAIYSASQHGIKLLVTFVNNWEQFGGMAQYCKWAELAGIEITDDHDDFYTNETIKSWYKNYVSTLLNRVNVYSGIKYKDDPAIFAWELANEPRCESDAYCKNNIVYNWAKEMSEYVKSIDPDHLVAVGDEGFTNYGYSDFEEGDHKYVYYGSAGMDFNKLISIPTIDFGTPHIYCDQWGLTDEQARFWFAHHYDICTKHNKPVILEEFNWKERTGRVEILRGWFDILEGKDKNYPDVHYAGTNYWMLASVMEAEGKLYQDYDGYTIYFRNDTDGTPNPTADSLAVVLEHAKYMNSLCLNNSLSADEFIFDKQNPADISFDMLFDLGELTSIKADGKALTKNTDYTVSGDKVTLKKSMLNSLDDGYVTFTLGATSGNSAKIIGKVYDSEIAPATVNPEKAQYYKNSIYSQDIKATLTSNGRTFRAVYNGTDRLTLGEEYTLSGNIVTISKDYLQTLTEGKYSIRYDFDRGIDPTTEVEVKTFKEVYECESDFDFGSIEGWEHTEIQFDDATCVRMRSNKFGAINIEFPADGEYNFTMRATGKYEPLVNTLFIDSKEAGVFNIQVNEAALTDTTITVEVTKGIHEIKVQFADDYDSLNDYMKITAKSVGEVNPEKTEDTDTDTNMETDIDTSSESEENTDVATDTETDVNTEVDTEKDTDANTDIGTDNTDIGTDNTDSETESDAVTDTDIGTDIDTNIETVLGDVNNDGFVDILDVVMVRAHIVGTKPIADSEMEVRADVNSDDIVDIIDVVIMRNKIVNG